MKKLTKRQKLEKFLPRLNKILSLLVFVLAIYIISIPFLPEIEYMFNSRKDDTSGYIYRSSAAIDAGEDETNLKPPPEGNRIIIPAIQVDAEILEGEDISILNENGQTWRRPKTSNPVDAGNTVIVAHRFFQHGKNTFYHLNKVSQGDEIVVFWDGEEHIYKVEKVFETDPSNIAIENNTGEEVLTLYTCSGLSAERRFVVQALPVKT